MFRYIDLLFYGGSIIALLFFTFRYAAKKFIEMQLETYKLRLSNDLKIKEFEHSVKFTKMHEERAEVIKELYSKFVGIHLMCTNFLDSDTPDVREAFKGADFAQIGKYFFFNRIFLTHDHCQQIQELLKRFVEVTSEMLQVDDLDDQEFDKVRILSGHKKIKAMMSDLRNAMTELENEFRKAIGAA